MRFLILAFLATVISINDVDALDNGVAITPPMGWLTWQRYRCTTDCEGFPDQCISDKLIRRMADAMVHNGYLAAGYEYIIIDDCWLEMNRSENGELVEDKVRFPHGMPALIDYVHSKGLKFGIYQDYGVRTCAGYPGLYGHEKVDIEKLANWGIDYIKVDGCYYINYEQEDVVLGYQRLKQLLNATGRPIVFSCEYPVYNGVNGIPTDYSIVADVCNMWRFYSDVDDGWSSVLEILDHIGLKQDVLQKHAGPGRWNDPDMLVVGNYGLSYEQSKVQMALWAVLAAPLIMSNDLYNIREEYKQILLNKKIIAVDQDPLGIQGLRVFRDNQIEVWARKVTPVSGKNYSYAIAIYSRRIDGAPFRFRTPMWQIGLTASSGYTLEDLYTDARYPEVYFPTTNLTVDVNPTGVVFLKASVLD